MKSSFVAVLLAVMVIAASASISDLSAHVNRLHAETHELLANPPAHLQQACLTSLISLSTSFLSSSCTTGYSTLTSLVSGSSANLPSTATLQSFCASTCVSDLQSKLTTVRTNCAGSILSSYVDNLRYVQLALSIPCMTDTDGSYCVAKVGNFLTTAANLLSSSNPTAAAASAVCSTCVTKFVTAVSSVFPGVTSAGLEFLNLACLKVNNEFCIPSIGQLKAFLPLNVSTVDGTYPASSLNAVCSPCARAYVNKLASLDVLKPSLNIPDVFKPLTTGLRYLCMQDSGNNYCVNTIYSAIKSGDTTVSTTLTACATLPIGTCSAACKTGMQSLANKFGCCLSPIFSKIGINYALARNATAAICKVDLVPTCATSTVSGVLAIKNLNKAWIQSNTASFKNAVIQDLAALASVPVDRISLSKITFPDGAVLSSINELQQTSSDTKVAFSVIPDSNSQAASIQTYLSSNLKSDAAVLPSTTNLGEDARADPTQSLAVDATASSSTGPSQSSSAKSSLTFSPILATILSFALVYFFN